MVRESRFFLGFSTVGFPKSQRLNEVFGAGGGSRTHTALRPTDFESV
jgi:hypothetical protein